MPSIRVTICHNDTAQFQPYQPDDPLTPVYTITADLPDQHSAMKIAEWTFSLLNADLGTLESAGADDGGFLHACVYRLLRLSSLSVGDVICIDSGGGRLWMTCDLWGWTTVSPPLYLGDDLTLAARVYQQLVRQWLR